MQPVAEEDVVADRQGQRVRALEDHADLLAHLDELDVRVVDVVAEDLDAARRADVAQAFVDPVDAAQEGRLAAAGRADQRGDDALLDVEVDVEQRLEGAVPEVELARLDGESGRPWLLRAVSAKASLHVVAWCAGPRRRR